ncbi:MAG: enoyl-CoA hydratase/isomerase family protein [Alphaproteobacteria bacterium]|nr:enoyl-CoA hydratase/isomerase family protein [Alphaproteobacteria bacterium]
MFKFEAANHVATVTLSRPPVNAINNEWIAGFGDILDKLEGRDDLTVLHIRSDQKVFSAGADLRQMEARFADPDGHLSFPNEVRGFQLLYRRIERSTLISLAEINGAAMGGGLELTLACDLRMAANEARLGVPEITIGMLPGAGGTQRLTRLLGKGSASRMILTGEPVMGEEALHLGLVEWAVPRAELEAAAKDRVTRLAALSRPALSHAKACIAEALRPGHEGYERELAATSVLLRTPEARSLVDTFLNKRK